jgi:hypothetical protein
MNYLSSSNYFHIKNPFSILFIQFKRVLDWASIIRKPQGVQRKKPETRGTVPEGRRVYSVKAEGLLCKTTRPKGYPTTLAARFKTDAPA